MAAIKSQYRNRIKLESDLRVAVSTIQPRIHLVSNWQAHPSHWVSTARIFTLCQFLWLAQARTARFPWDSMVEIEDKI
jgi:hypothetical protein